MLLMELMSGRMLVTVLGIYYLIGFKDLVLDMLQEILVTQILLSVLVLLQMVMGQT